MIEDLIVGKEPKHVRPPEAARGTVGILRTVGEGVVDTMRRDQFDGSSLEGQRSAQGQEILEPLRDFEAAVGQQPMVAEGNPQEPRDPLEPEEHPKGAPREGEWRKQHAGMDDGDADQDVPFCFDVRLNKFDLCDRCHPVTSLALSARSFDSPRTLCFAKRSMRGSLRIPP